MPKDAKSGVYYELHGQGVPLLLGFPLMASQAEIFGQEAGRLLERYLEGLVDRYQVLVLDYPSIGRSEDMAPQDLTADRVANDLESVADAAGFSHYIYWGYSWGAAAGLQLAWRSTRLLALIVGGWPPLGAQYPDMLKASLDQLDDPPPEVQVVLRSPAQYAQWSAFYGSVQAWPEREAAAQLKCPALAYVGENGNVSAGSEMIRNASILREHRRELQALGWHVELIPDGTHETTLEPGASLPLVRKFLDAQKFDV